MLPIRTLPPALDGFVLAISLLAAALAGGLASPSRTIRLDEETMPDWQRRDLGLLDGRPRRRG